MYDKKNITSSSIVNPRVLGFDDLGRGKLNANEGVHVLYDDKIQCNN